MNSFCGERQNRDHKNRKLHNNQMKRYIDIRHFNYSVLILKKFGTTSTYRLSKKPLVQRSRKVFPRSETIDTFFWVEKLLGGTWSKNLSSVEMVELLVLGRS